MQKPYEIKRAWILLLVLILTIACAIAPSTVEPAPGQLETIVAATLAAHTASALKVTLTTVPALITPIASVTPESTGELFVYTSSENVNLRVMPGMLFQVSRVLAKNTRLKVIGRSPGGEWLNVINNESIIGWVHVDFVQGGHDGPPPPTVEPGTVILVTGRVVDSTGAPVSGIGFSITQGTRRTDATTDETGRFYAFLPNTMSGTWSVGFISIACTSNVMDSNCNCLNGTCGKPDPQTMSVALPPAGVLNFTWK